MYISYDNMFTYVHKEKYCDNICETATGGNREGSAECFSQKLMVTTEVKGGKSGVC
jgi:hypothetical protein